MYIYRITVLVVGLIAGTLQGAEEPYRLPPQAVLDILDAPAAPQFSLSPNNQWLVITDRDLDYSTIAELAEPMLMLAGTRFKQYPDSRIEKIGITRLVLRHLTNAVERIILPPEGGRIASVAWVRDATSAGELAYAVIHNGAMTVHLYDAATGVDRLVPTPGLEGKVADLSFTRDGRWLAFTATTREGVSLWLADTRHATARQVPDLHLNHVNGGYSWTSGRLPLLVRAVVPNRGAPPPPPEVPAGPIIQESFGRAAQGRTFQDLLKTPHDEQLFEYYFTSQIFRVDENASVTSLGKPGIFKTVTSSPDGNYLLASTIQRPYSYQVGMSLFPCRTEVWTPSGELVRLVLEDPLRENLPSARDAVLPGIRSISWRPDAPATLVMVEALDDGDPQKQVPKRDRVSLLDAPFQDPPSLLAETEMRYGGILWAFPDVAFLTERSARTVRTKTWVVNPLNPAATPRLLWDRGAEDRYADPGAFVMTDHPTEPRQVPLRSADGRWLYLHGAGAAKDGARPFLDRLDLAALTTERLWQSAPPNYENLVEVLDPEARRIVFTRESPTQHPNVFLQDRTASQAVQLTDLPDPAPWFAGVKGELIRYQRPDGIQLSATLYLPPSYDQQRDGPLPCFFWAYPREFLTEEGASQLSGSPLQFKRPARQDHLLLLTQGYAVLDNPVMPIVGGVGREPNDSYVEQLVASAQAAADYLVALGVADRRRLAVGGHSYGAFMTANLLAHSDLFRAGIARSGAYNRTLTPFGFQAEPRTYWQAPETYHQMSPFTHAPKINEPLLLIHGMRDANAGTFPMQSERLFAALKGNGGNVRYVQLPLENHGYAARESRRHVLWEMITWLDQHVKPSPPAADAAATP